MTTSKPLTKAIIVLWFVVFGSIILAFDCMMGVTFFSSRPFSLVGFLCVLFFFALQAALVWLAFRRAIAAGRHPPPASGRPPDADKPSPLIPSQTHHLAAAKELPPSDDT